MIKLLLVEDDADFANILEGQLTDHGFQVSVCGNGSDALFFLRQQNYQLILLDRMLPMLDGLSFLRIIRDQNIQTPVIFITALGDLPDKVRGLNCGADDYLVKPFAFEELLARIQCILRRPQAMKTELPFTVGDLTWDALGQTLSCHDISCRLTGKESELLDLFLHHPGQVLPRNTIFLEIWEDSEVEFGNLDNYIYFLRNRLRSLQSRTRIETVRGVGYQLII